MPKQIMPIQNIPLPFFKRPASRMIFEANE